MFGLRSPAPPPRSFDKPGRLSAMLITTDTPMGLEPEDAAYIAAHLCRDRSEFQQELEAATAKWEALASELAASVEA